MVQGSGAGHVIAGFTLQFERAIYRMFDSATRKSKVGVETLDDVAEVRINPDGTISAVLEQDKNTVDSAKQPFQDRSYKLWHTIRLWLDGMQALVKSYDEISLCLVTNSVVPATTLVGKIDAATEKCDSLIAEIRSMSSSGSGATDLELRKICEYSDEEIGFVLSRVRVIDGAAHTEQSSFKLKTIENFRLPTDAEKDGEQIYHALLGMMVDQCQKMWNSRNPAWLEPASFYDRLWREVEQRQVDRFVNRPIISVPFREHITSVEGDHLFVRQLAAIPLSEKNIEQHLEAYWAFYAERVRLQAEGVVNPKAWEIRDAELYYRWRVCLEQAELTVSDSSKNYASDVAKNVFIKTINPDFTAKLDGRDTREFYFTQGNYHDLANRADCDFYVYWHEVYMNKITKD